MRSLISLIKILSDDALMSFQYLLRDLAALEFSIIILALLSSMKVPLSIVALAALAIRVGHKITPVCTIASFPLGMAIWYDWTAGEAIDHGWVAALGLGVVGVAFFRLLIAFHANQKP